MLREGCAISQAQGLLEEMKEVEMELEEKEELHAHRPLLGRSVYARRRASQQAESPLGIPPPGSSALTSFVTGP